MNSKPFRDTTWIDLWIVVAVLVAVVVITLIVTSSYREAVEAATLLGIIFPSAVAIASAAFGVTQTLKAGEAQKRTGEAEQRLQTVRGKSVAAFGLLQEVDPGEAYSALQRLGSSPAGETRLTVPVDGGADVTLDLDDLISQRVHFEQAKALLAEVAQVPD